jgi:hypothetical protein
MQSDNRSSPQRTDATRGTTQQPAWPESSRQDDYLADIDRKSLTGTWVLGMSIRNVFPNLPQGVARYRSTPDFRGAGTLLAPYPGGLRSCLAVLG